MADSKTETVTAFDIDIEVQRSGAGSPIVLLYDEEALALDTPVIDALSASNEVVVISPPGFGASGRPGWIETPDDLAYIVLDVMNQLGLEDAGLVGFSLGGWIAAEMATKSTRRIARLALFNPYGIKVGGPTDRDIQDIWYLPPDKVLDLKYSDTATGEIDYTVMPEEKLEVVARNRESFGRFCWQPYMHNPKLKARLHLIDVPTLIGWGADDGLMTQDYGRAFAAEIPGARFELIDKAGHFPHVEQPDAVTALLTDFLAGATAS